MTEAVELHLAPAHVLVELLRTRQLSAVELLELHLARIERHNSALNAVVGIDAERAREQAAGADAASARGKARGPLHGLPMTLKDSFAIAGMRTTCGHEPLRDHVPEHDATIAARLRAAGAIIVGRTNVATLVDDFQTDNSIHGRTNNPWALDRTPGGSSGGAAAALASGLTALDIGSDLGGSIRIPAHFCGVYGLRPTDGRVPGTGHIPPLPERPRGVRCMQAYGPMARDLDDLELALRVIAGPDGIDPDVAPVELASAPISDPRSLRLAFAPAFGSVGVAMEIVSAIDRLVEGISTAGVRIEERLPALDFDAADHLRRKLVRLVTSVFGPASDEVPVEQRTADWYLRAMDRRDAYGAAWEVFLTDVDAFICPVAMTVAFPHAPTGDPLQSTRHRCRTGRSRTTRAHSTSAAIRPSRSPSESRPTASRSESSLSVVDGRRCASSASRASSSASACSPASRPHLDGEKERAAYPAPPRRARIHVAGFPPHGRSSQSVADLAPHGSYSQAAAAQPGRSSHPAGIRPIIGRYAHPTGIRANGSRARHHRVDPCQEPWGR